MNYLNAKIYKIRSDSTEQCYIGSTSQKYLTSRLSIHRYHYKKWIENNKNYISSFKIIKYDDHCIELISEHFNITKQELHKLEGELILQTPNCVNIKIEGGNPKDSLKRYRIKNRIKINLHAIEYYNNHKDKKKLYYQQNKDKIRLYYQHRKQMELLT